MQSPSSQAVQKSHVMLWTRSNAFVSLAAITFLFLPHEKQDSEKVRLILDVFSFWEGAKEKGFLAVGLSSKWMAGVCCVFLNRARSLWMRLSWFFVRTLTERVRIDLSASLASNSSVQLVRSQSAFVPDSPESVYSTQTRLPAALKSLSTIQDNLVSPLHSPNPGLFLIPFIIHIRTSA